MDRYIAEKLLEIKAVTLSPDEPFTWSSGILSPIYCDNRLSLGYPDVRRAIYKEMTKQIQRDFPETELIAGTATSGIPYAAWISEELNLPMCYVRSKPKGHGKGNQIEGVYKPGQKVVVIEDLISTGKSSIAVANALKEAGCEVLCVISIFSYELEKASQQFRAAGLKYQSLSGFPVLLDVALEKGYISMEEQKQINRWRENPTEWEGANSK